MRLPKDQYPGHEKNGKDDDDGTRCYYEVAQGFSHRFLLFIPVSGKAVGAWKITNPEA
jgi:hypothetical protein